MEVDIADARAKGDMRALTELEVNLAVSCLLLGEAIDPATRRKCEKDDYRLYGIKIGTTVTSRDKTKTGALIAVNMDENDGFNKFTIRWGEQWGKSGGGKIEQYSTYDALRDADPGQGVISLCDDETLFGEFLRRVVVLVCTHGHYFITHNGKVRRKYPCHKLREDRRQDVLDVRQDAWEKTREAAAAGTLNAFELALLEGDAGLIDAIQEKGSCRKMMGLASDDVTANSLLFNDLDFHSTHAPWVNHFVRGAQASWRLGRLVSMESCLAPMCVNELDLPRRIEIGELEKDLAIYQMKAGDADKYGLATRALLARATVGDGGSCHWRSHYPLYRLFHLSRPDRLGDVSPRSENTKNVSPTRRHLDVYEGTSRLSKTRDEDLKIFRLMDREYDPIGQAKKVLAEIREGELARLGAGAKVVGGRMPALDDETADDDFRCVEEMMMRNSVEPFLAKVPNRVKSIETCVDVLKRGASYNKRRANEDHFYPRDKRKEIDSIVDQMMADGMTRKTVAALSCALHVADSVTASCLRPEDSLGCNAADTSVMAKKNRDGKEINKVRAVLPPDCKNRESLHRSNTGVAIIHTKDDVVTDGYVVMVVIARRIMRELLAAKVKEEQLKLKAKGGPNLSKRMNAIGCKYQLTEKLCPFTEDGEAYDNSKLYDLYKYVGRRALGIPRFGPNILRSVHVTKVVRYCLLNDIDPNHSDVVRLFALARHGEDERVKTYDLMKAELVALGGDSNLFGHLNRGINSTSGASSSSSGRSSRALPDQASSRTGGLPGMEDFGEMLPPEHQASTQAPSALHASSSVNDRLVQMVDESHRREVEQKDRDIEQKDKEIAVLKAKRKSVESAPSAGETKKQKVVSSLVQERAELLQDMHPHFVKVAKEVWSEESSGVRFVMVNGEKRNSLGYLLKMARTTPTSLLEERVEEKMRLVEPEFCGKFYKMFTNQRLMRYTLAEVPSCWPTWSEEMLGDEGSVGE
ncbi:unnamed protein product [Ectocarpus sp. 12 AP-2014]